MNIGAGEGLQDVLKSNLGPSGTLKMYVSAFSLHDVTKLTDSQVGGRCRRSMLLNFSRIQNVVSNANKITDQID